MADDTGPGTLKLVIGVSGSRGLAPHLEEALGDRVASHNVRILGEHAVLVFTDAPVDEVRGWLSDVLRAGESLIVAEFEAWSSSGPEVDTQWLLRRGH